MDNEPQCGSLHHHHHHLQHHHHPQHHIQHRHISSSVEDGGEEEELDPRIQVELEKLNRATEEINRLELELDDARASFRQVLSDSSQRLNGLAKKLGVAVDKARPYYDARMKLKEAHLESQKAALRFERACSMHEAAKEMVQLAEEGYKRREEDLDPTWQEMLNHATMKVNDAESERIESESNHQSTTLNFKKKEEEVQKLQRELKRAITKSKPYFEMKAKFNQVMEDHKRKVSRLEEDVASTKALYSEALRNLEAISDDIHRQRLERRQKMQLGIRGAGVGAESPSPPPSWDKGINIEGSAAHVYHSDGEEDENEGTLKKSKKRWKEQGIVGYELPFCHQTSIADDHDLDASSLKSDPLNLVVFKTDSCHQDTEQSSSFGINNFQPPSIIHADVRTARSLSYRQAVNQNHEHHSVEKMDGERSCHESEMPNKADSQILLSSTYPRTREVDAMQSSLSRAQEWVNKSPIPQQRRFIKSKSLIDASSQPLTSTSAPVVQSSTPPPHGTSSSFTTNQLSATRLQEDQVANSLLSSSKTTSSALSARLSQNSQQPLSHHQHQHSQQQQSHHHQSGTTIDTPIQIQPHLPPCSQPKSSPRSASTTPDRSSPISNSPTGKSPKLQGLILRVDAAGIIPSPSPPATRPHSYHRQDNPGGVISTKDGHVQHQQQQQPQSSSSSSPTSSATKSNATPLSSASSPPPSYAANTTTTVTNNTLIPTTKTTSSSMRGFKLPTYSSKTAPASAFHLPSPTGNRATLSSIPPPAFHQMTSPTPPSPSGDRVSILSGRSDSSKGGLLRPPSDTSDTESIASTGPMLDDDQVEFLTMDFTEQSIASTGQSQVDDGDFDGVSRAGLDRGHWTRMSLPPRLSYLGSYLEQATQLAHMDGNMKDDMGNGHDVNDDDGYDVSPVDSDRVTEDVSAKRKEEEEVLLEVNESVADVKVETEKSELGSEGLNIEGAGLSSDVNISVTIHFDEEDEKERRGETEGGEEGCCPLTVVSDGCGNGGSEGGERGKLELSDVGERDGEKMPEDVEC